MPYNFSLKSIQLFSLLLIMSFGNSLSGQAKSNKKALLIGVGAYPVAGGWATLNSKNDLTIIKDALLSQGFLSENISIIEDALATKQNIIATIKT